MNKIVSKINNITMFADGANRISPISTIMIHEKRICSILSPGNFPIDEDEMSAILQLALAAKDDASESS